MPTALFVVSIYNYHREVLPVIENFSRNGWRVVVALGWRGESADEAAATYAALGCAVEWIPEAMAYRGEAPRSTAIPATQPVELMVERKRNVARPLISFFGALRQMITVRRWVARFMRQVQPDAVLSGPFHSNGKFDNAFLWASRRRSIIHCCYPVSAYHGRKSAILARFNNLAMGMLPAILRTDFDGLNRLMAKLFPQWTQTSEGTTIFMWEPMGMLAAHLTGLMDGDVWQKPSPNFDAVFVFNRFSRNLLAANDFPMGKVSIVGIPLLDAVVARASGLDECRRLHDDLGLGENEPFLLFNVEPSAEHHYCDWDRHWQNFRSMMGIVARLGMPVVLSLHPLCHLEDYVFAEGEFGVRISRQWKIHDLYPHCGFVVSFPCSTNLIAETFGKPLAIYDFFMIAHPDSPRVDEFRLPGALVGHTLPEIEANIRQLAAPAAPMELGGAVLPAPTFVPASDAIRTRVENLLNDAKKRIAVT